MLTSTTKQSSHRQQPSSSATTTATTTPTNSRHKPQQYEQKHLPSKQLSCSKRSKCPECESAVSANHHSSKYYHPSPQSSTLSTATRVFACCQARSPSCSPKQYNLGLMHNDDDYDNHHEQQSPQAKRKPHESTRLSVSDELVPGGEGAVLLEGASLLVVVSSQAQQVAVAGSKALREQSQTKLPTSGESSGFLEGRDSQIESHVSELISDSSSLTQKISESHMQIPLIHHGSNTTATLTNPECNEGLNLSEIQVQEPSSCKQIDDLVELASSSCCSLCAVDLSNNSLHGDGATCSCCSLSSASLNSSGLFCSHSSDEDTTSSHSRASLNQLYRDCERGDYERENEHQAKFTPKKLVSIRERALSEQPSHRKNKNNSPIQDRSNNPSRKKEKIVKLAQNNNKINHRKCDHQHSVGSPTEHSSKHQSKMFFRTSSNSIGCSATESEIIVTDKEKLENDSKNEGSERKNRCDTKKMQYKTNTPLHTRGKKLSSRISSRPKTHNIVTPVKRHISRRQNTKLRSAVGTNNNRHLSFTCPNCRMRFLSSEPKISINESGPSHEREEENNEQVRIQSVNINDTASGKGESLKSNPVPALKYENIAVSGGSHSSNELQATQIVGPNSLNDKSLLCSVQVAETAEITHHPTASATSSEDKTQIKQNQPILSNLAPNTIAKQQSGTMNLLSPMDFVPNNNNNNNRSVEVRALSCTEANLPRALIVQLASVRSKSLCVSREIDIPAKQDNPTKGSLITKHQLQSPAIFRKDIGRKVTQLARKAFKRIRRLSTSMGQINDQLSDRPSSIEHTESLDRGNQATARSDSFRRRRSTRWFPPESALSISASAFEGQDEDLQVVPHQLDKFMQVSYSSAINQLGETVTPTTVDLVPVHNGGSRLSLAAPLSAPISERRVSSLSVNAQQGISISSTTVAALDDDERPFYSSSGVYVGPGGVCSWKDVQQANSFEWDNSKPPVQTKSTPQRAKVLPQRHKSMAIDSDGRPTSPGEGGAVSWLKKPLLHRNVAQVLGFKQKWSTNTSSDNSIEDQQRRLPVVIRVASIHSDNSDSVDHDQWYDSRPQDGALNCYNNSENENTEQSQLRIKLALKQTKSFEDQLIKPRSYQDNQEQSSSSYLNEYSTERRISRCRERIGALVSQDASSRNLIGNSTRGISADQEDERYNEQPYAIGGTKSESCSRQGSQKKHQQNLRQVVLTKTVSNNLLESNEDFQVFYGQVSRSQLHSKVAKPNSKCSQSYEQRQKSATTSTKTSLSSTHMNTSSNRTSAIVDKEVDNAKSSRQWIFNLTHKISAPQYARKKGHKSEIAALLTSLHSHSSSATNLNLYKNDNSYSNTNASPSTHEESERRASECLPASTQYSDKIVNSRLHRLMKNNRSNSLNGLFSNNSKLTTFNRMIEGEYKSNQNGQNLIEGELSKSSLELNCINQIVEETNLYLAQLNARYSISSNELIKTTATPTNSCPNTKLQVLSSVPHENDTNWFRRSFKNSTSNQAAMASRIKSNDNNSLYYAVDVDKNNDNNIIIKKNLISHFTVDSTSNNSIDQNSKHNVSHQPSSLDGTVSTALVSSSVGGTVQKEEQASRPWYGANLQTICVHCQLIAELANNPASAYLAQLLSNGQHSYETQPASSQANLETKIIQPFTTPIVRSSRSSRSCSNSSLANYEENGEFCHHEETANDLSKPKHKQQPIELSTRFDIDDEVSEVSSHRPVRPSVVLTACSNQATLDETDLSDQNQGQSSEQYNEIDDSSCKVQKQNKNSFIKVETEPKDGLLAEPKVYQRKHRCRSASSASLISCSSTEDEDCKAQLEEEEAQGTSVVVKCNLSYCSRESSSSELDANDEEEKTTLDDDEDDDEEQDRHNQSIERFIDDASCSSTSYLSDEANSDYEEEEDDDDDDISSTSSTTDTGSSVSMLKSSSGSSNSSSSVSEDGHLPISNVPKEKPTVSSLNAPIGDPKKSRNLAQIGEDGANVQDSENVEPVVTHLPIEYTILSGTNDRESENDLSMVQDLIQKNKQVQERRRRRRRRRRGRRRRRVERAGSDSQHRSAKDQVKENQESSSVELRHQILECQGKVQTQEEEKEEDRTVADVPSAPQTMRTTGLEQGDDKAELRKKRRLPNNDRQNFVDVSVAKRGHRSDQQKSSSTTKGQHLEKRAEKQGRRRAKTKAKLTQGDSPLSAKHFSEARTANSSAQGSQGSMLNATEEDLNAEVTAAAVMPPRVAGGTRCGAQLEVPANKQNRSASLDTTYLLKVPKSDLNLDASGNLYNDDDDESYLNKAARSRSVDISLPTKPGEFYSVAHTPSSSSAGASSAAAIQKQAGSKLTGRILRDQREKKFIQGEIKIACANGETRALKLFVDWKENCVNGEHLWIYVGSSSEACYVGENECLKHGPRLCCSACKITAHTGCISILIDKIKFICKHTFKDLTVSNPRHLKELQQQNVIYHHWVHKRTHCGRCKQCTKTFGNTKLPFSSKEIQAITCSWCKVSYHNKENCYTLSALTEPCTLGAHRESIIPPPWILKLPSSSTNEVKLQVHSHQQSIAPKDENKPNKDPVELLQPMQIVDLNTSNQSSLNPTDTNREINTNPAKRHLNNQMQHSNPTSRCINQNYGSNTTLLTDTSGYMSADNSNMQPGHNMNNNISNSSLQAQYNKMISDNHERSKQSANDCQEQELVDQVALQTVDLSTINQHNVYQKPQQPLRERQQHPQENLSQFQRHQMKQYYRQMDANQNNDQTKLYIGSDSADGDHSVMMDYQLTQQNPKDSYDGLYKNFKIVPHPIQGLPTAGSKPVLVFVNPRSGGNQGAKMMQKFNWLLNPRQVFDLIQSGGPRAALELFRDVPNLRILTIGGDGTASWILSYLDEVGIPNRIPVAVLPLGTGNDLARALGWGGGYADEPIAKILTQVRDGEIVQLDRWNLHVERNLEVALNSPNEFSSTSTLGISGTNNSVDMNSQFITSSPSYFGSLSQCNTTNTASTVSIIDQTNCDTNLTQTATTNAMSSFNPPADEAGSERLPMDVINNYFSFGVDAHIALEFHTAREAHPERFNSRLRNKMFYGQAGGKDLLKRKWKDLSNYVTLYCDGQDMTSRLKELKVHSVLFLNIPSYGGGTRPWPTTTTTTFAKPRTDDGLIEVIGLTTYQLPLLQAGGHGTCIAQCRTAKIITSRTIPMQVDGEPCKLLPSIININFKNRVCMLGKSKSSNKNTNMTNSNLQKVN